MDFNWIIIHYNGFSWIAFLQNKVIYNDNKIDFVVQICYNNGL